MHFGLTILPDCFRRLVVAHCLHTKNSTEYDYDEIKQALAKDADETAWLLRLV